MDKPNYFNVTVWGAQGENAARYLSKGRPVAIDGRLEWREWETPTGEKRQGTEIIADSVQFLGSANNGAAQPSDAIPPQEEYVPVPAGAGAGADDPEIPF